MKTLFVIIFLFADGSMKFNAKTFDSVEACKTHLEYVQRDVNTPEAEEFAKQNGISHIVSFCTTKLQEAQ